MYKYEFILLYCFQWEIPKTPILEIVCTHFDEKVHNLVRIIYWALPLVNSTEAVFKCEHIIKRRTQTKFLLHEVLKNIIILQEPIDLTTEHFDEYFLIRRLT